MQRITKAGTHYNLRQNEGDVEIVRLLLENGADANTTNNHGVTALASAVFRGYIDIAQLLVEKGADVNTKEDNETTVLMVAAEAGQTNAVVFLLNKGALHQRDELVR